MKKKKNNKKKIFAFLIILVICGICACYFLFLNSDDSSVKVLDTIENYSYTLNDNDSSLKKELFYDLKDELEKDAINDEEYVKLIAKLFVVDVFSLETKLSKYDIGGLDYISPSKKDEFKILMGNTLYDSIENNFDGKRKQSLPLVTSVEIENIEETTFKFDNSELMSYDISLEWEYSDDLGYDTAASVIISKIDNIMYVMEYSTK